MGCVAKSGHGKSQELTTGLDSGNQEFWLSPLLLFHVTGNLPREANTHLWSPHDEQPSSCTLNSLNFSEPIQRPFLRPHSPHLPLSLHSDETSPGAYMFTHMHLHRPSYFTHLIVRPSTASFQTARPSLHLQAGLAPGQAPLLPHHLRWTFSTWPEPASSLPAAATAAEVHPSGLYLAPASR